MQTFHISAAPAGGSWRPTNIDVKTSIGANGVGQAKVTTERSVTNPIYILSTGAMGSPDLHRTSRTVTVDGASNASLDAAVKSLDALGARHGVIGINLSSDPKLTGTVMFEDAPGVFTGGGPTTQRVGAENLRAIDAAARAVLAAAVPAG